MMTPQPSSSPKMLASLIGFDNPVWSAQYYPEECPEDWRMAYFMNDFAAVYLPADTWYQKPEFIEALVQELEANFQIVLEFPPIKDESEMDTAIAQMQKIHANIACVVIDAAALDFSAIARQTKKLTAYAINLDCQSQTPKEALLELAQSIKAGFVWRPKQVPQALKPCSYQLARMPCMSLRELKPVLQTLSLDTETGIFFEPEKASPKRAKEARTLIELMGLA